MAHHIQDSELLRSLDGELSKARFAYVKDHLAVCWICRTRLHDLEGTIDRYVHVHMDEFDQLIPEISGPRSLLRARIAHLESEEQPGFWECAFKSFGRWSVPSFVAGGLFLAVLAVAVFLGRPKPDGLSALEMLRRAEATERDAFNSKTQPVMYQRLDLRFAGRRYERVVYLDKNRSRSVINVKNAVGRVESEVDASRALAPVERAFTESALDWKEPLSPSRMSNWRSALRGRTERIVTDPKFTEIVTKAAEGPIVEAQVRFRNADFHPVSETLRLRNDSVVEIAELDYKVIELSELRSDFFDGSSGVTFAAMTPTISTMHGSFAENLKLELDVVERLDEASAFLDGQLSVERSTNGVSVRGVVDDPQRRRQIFSALGSTVNDPALRVAIAVPEGMQAAPRSNDAVSVEGVETLQRAPADDKLRAFFSRKASGGTNTDEQVQRFAAEVSLHSQLARSQAAVLRQIAELFTAEDLRAMTPAEHRRWRAMLAAHALSVLSETRSTRENLEPIFRENAEDKRPLLANPVTDSDFIYAATKLADLAASNDSAVWRSFSASMQASKVTLVCLPEFWDSLLDAEILAQQISVAASES